MLPLYHNSIIRIPLPLHQFLPKYSPVSVIIWILFANVFYSWFYIYFYKNMTELHNSTTEVVGDQVNNNGGVPVLILLGLLVVVLLFFVRRIAKNKIKPKSCIAIVGERFSGKTQLFISLNQGKKMRTVPSIHNNRTSYKLGTKTYQLIDYIGDNISKEEVLQQVQQVYAVIHVIDGADDKTISDAAMFMYRMLVSKSYQENNCHYVIFLNKVEMSGYLGRAQIEQKLEDEIQHIKQSRISQGEENQNEDDFIKLSKNRFKIPFKIVEGSAESNIKDLQMTLENF